MKFYKIWGINFYKEKKPCHFKSMKSASISYKTYSKFERICFALGLPEMPIKKFYWEYANVVSKDLYSSDRRKILVPVREEKLAKEMNYLTAKKLLNISFEFKDSIQNPKNKNSWLLKLRCECDKHDMGIFHFICILKKMAILYINEYYLDIRTSQE